MTNHASVDRMWSRYLATLDDSPESTARTFALCQFSDNQAEIDALAELVLRGQKRATAPSLWELESTGESMPAVGDLQIVTNWAGEAVCVIETTFVDLVPYALVSEAFAAREGEGDGSLAYWRRAHWAYYGRVLAEVGRAPTHDMPIVCESFECVYPVANASGVD